MLIAIVDAENAAAAVKRIWEVIQVELSNKRIAVLKSL